MSIMLVSVSSEKLSCTEGMTETLCFIEEEDVKPVNVLESETS